MKYKNSLHKKSKNTFPLEVMCGNGNLIKLQGHRIIESQFNLETHQGHLHCIKCNEVLANRGVHRGKTTYFVIRGMINSKKVNNYSY